MNLSSPGALDSRLSPRGEAPAHALQVFGGVHACFRSVRGHGNGDAVAMPERAQLFQRLEAFNRRRLQPVIKVQESDAVGVNADMAVSWQPCRRRALI